MDLNSMKHEYGFKSKYSGSIINHLKDSPMKKRLIKQENPVIQECNMEDVDDFNEDKKLI